MTDLDFERPRIRHGRNLDTPASNVNLERLHPLSREVVDFVNSDWMTSEHTDVNIPSNRVIPLLQAGIRTIIEMAEEAESREDSKRGHKNNRSTIRPLDPARQGLLAQVQNYILYQQGLPPAFDETVGEATPVPDGRADRKLSKKRFGIKGGACTGLDPSIFSPLQAEKGPGMTGEEIKASRAQYTAAVDYAKGICRKCVKINECLEYALDMKLITNADPIMGGKTGLQRRKILKDRKLAPQLEILRTC